MCTASSAAVTISSNCQRHGAPSRLRAAQIVLLAQLGFACSLAVEAAARSACVRQPSSGSAVENYVSQLAPYRTFTARFCRSLNAASKMLVVAKSPLTALAVARSPCCTSLEAPGG